jgi:hypothetical protein
VRDGFGELSRGGRGGGGLRTSILNAARGGGGSGPAVACTPENRLVHVASTMGLRDSPG